jgi:uncharacterized protein
LTVAVLVSSEDSSSLEKILISLNRVGVDAYGLKFHNNWEALGRETIMNRLEKASHFLAVMTASNLASSWFAFVAGYGYSRGSNYSLFRSEKTCANPRYLAGLKIIGDFDELEAYYKIERDSWLILDERRASRATLLEMGISCHNDSLAQCARDGDTRAVELFLKAGFPPDARDKYGVPLLCLAARGKHRAVAETLLLHGAQLDLQSEDRGYSPLMDAAHAGSVDLVKLFLEKGANPDLTSKDGQTALVVAVGRNDAEVAKLLVEGGSNLDLADKLGLSARKYAALFKNPSILSLLEVTS